MCPDAFLRVSLETDSIKYTYSSTGMCTCVWLSRNWIIHFWQKRSQKVCSWKAGDTQGSCVMQFKFEGVGTSTMNCSPNFADVSVVVQRLGEKKTICKLRSPRQKECPGLKLLRGLALNIILHVFLYFWMNLTFELLDYEAKYCPPLLFWALILSIERWQSIKAVTRGRRHKFGSPKIMGC